MGEPLLGNENQEVYQFPMGSIIKLGNPPSSLEKGNDTEDNNSFVTDAMELDTVPDINCPSGLTLTKTEIEQRARDLGLLTDTMSSGQVTQALGIIFQNMAVKSINAVENKKKVFTSSGAGSVPDVLQSITYTIPPNPPKSYVESYFGDAKAIKEGSTITESSGSSPKQVSNFLGALLVSEAGKAATSTNIIRPAMVFYTPGGIAIGSSLVNTATTNKTLMLQTKACTNPGGTPGVSDMLLGKAVLLNPNVLPAGSIFITTTGLSASGLFRVVKTSYENFVNFTRYFTGTNTAELATYRSGNWYFADSLYGDQSSTVYGVSGDMPYPRDFDGDGIPDLAVWRPSNQHWYVKYSSTKASKDLGVYGIPTAPYYDWLVPDDFDGDRKADLATWRSSDGHWYVKYSSSGVSTDLGVYGVPGSPYYDVAVPGNYDGDAKTDRAVYRTSSQEWYIKQSSTGQQATVVKYGIAGDKPVPADYDGDGKTDRAVWRPSNGRWYAKYSSTGDSVDLGANGISGDILVPRDYDGDGRADRAVWRPSNGYWYIYFSSDGAFYSKQWGQSSDIPL